MNEVELLEWSPAIFETCDVLISDGEHTSEISFTAVVKWMACEQRSFGDRLRVNKRTDAHLFVRQAFEALKNNGCISSTDKVLEPNEYTTIFRRCDQQRIVMKFFQVGSAWIHDDHDIRVFFDSG